MSKRPRYRRMITLVWLAGALFAFAEILLPFERVELSNNLSRVYFGRDILSETEWDAQSFSSGSARKLKRVVLNLFREPGATATGTYWVRLYDASGAGGGPGTNAVATIVQNQNIADLEANPEHTVMYWGLSIPLQLNQTYFIVVGTDAGGEGLRWGYTNDPVGANGFPSLFTYSGDGGATWRTPFMNALPQRIQVVGDQDE